MRRPRRCASGNTIAFHTWIFGTIGVIVLTLGSLLLTPGIDADSVIAVIAGSIACVVFAPMSMMFRGGRPEASRPVAIPRPPIAGIVVMALLIVGNLILTRGWLY